jgi:hypothetical protein
MLLGLLLPLSTFGEYADVHGIDTGDVAGLELSYEGMTEKYGGTDGSSGSKTRDVIGWERRRPTGPEASVHAFRTAVACDRVRHDTTSGMGLGTTTPVTRQAMRSLSADRWSGAGARRIRFRFAAGAPQHWMFFNKIRTMSADRVGASQSRNLGKSIQPC